MNNITVIYYPDVHFKEYIEKTYGINRGVYNTIDRWFYEKEFFEVEKRRKLIIEFLTHFKGYNDESILKIHFGKGNLVNCLNNYLNSITCEERSDLV